MFAIRLVQISSLAILAAASPGLSVSAAVFVTDQEFFPEGVSETQVLGGLSGMAQTFTVGRNGTFAQLEIRARRLEGMGLEVRDVASNLPGSTVFGSFSLPDIDLTEPIAVSVDVSSMNLSLEIGDQLAFVFTGGSGNISAAEADFVSETYSGGIGYLDFSAPIEFVNGGGDFFFRTLVSVPEPDCGPLAVAAALLAFGWFSSTQARAKGIVHNANRQPCRNC